MNSLIIKLWSANMLTRRWVNLKIVLLILIFFSRANSRINYIPIILEFSRPNRRGKFVCFGGCTFGVDLTRSSYYTCRMPP